MPFQGISRGLAWKAGALLLTPSLLFAIVLLFAPHSDRATRAHASDLEHGINSSADPQPRDSDAFRRGGGRPSQFRSLMDATEGERMTVNVVSRFHRRGPANALGDKP
jgi:hypothetical protein